MLDEQLSGQLDARQGGAATRSAHERYLDAILDLHQTLRFGQVAAVLRDTPTARVADLGNGTKTVATRTMDLPRRYLLGLAGFRLARYLAVGFASGSLTVSNALFGERIDHWHPQDWHIFTLDGQTGQILGYIAMARNGDPVPKPLSASDRRLFPVEVAHGIDLFRTVSAPGQLTTHEVLEIKRFVHSGDLADRRRRLRVTLELLHSLAWAAQSSAPPTRVIVGDAEVHVALRHLLMVGLHVVAVTGTRPRLPADDLMHPMYVTRQDVRPFYAALPNAEELNRTTDVLERACATPDVREAVRLLGAELEGKLETIPADGATAAWRKDRPDGHS